MTRCVRGQVLKALAGALFVGVGVWLAGVPIVWALLAAVNLVTFAAYGFDKRNAAAGKWRLPEAVLHVLTAAGGTFGAFAGQRVFRHKTRDTGFRIVFFCIVVMQVVGLALYAFWRFVPEA